MARILIIYGTTHGHTAKVAAALSETLRSQGAVVDVTPASNAHPNPDDHDGIIVAASVHGGRYQQPVMRWVRSHDAALNAKPTAFVSLCLGILQKEREVHRALQAIVDRFSAETGWKPTVTKMVAGALLYTKYNWFLRIVMRRIARKAGGGTDTRRDYEYTDWTDLAAFAVAFGRMVDARPVDVRPSAGVVAAG